MTRIQLLVAAILLVSATAWAQTASIGGRVADPQGGVVANAEVTLTPSGRTTRTAADGAFTFENVAPGTYTVLVTAAGFAPFSQSVTVGTSRSTIAATLQVAGVTEDITVAGALSGTAATGKTNLPLRDIPMTVHAVPAQVIQEQGVNDLVGALQNVPGVYAFTNYGVYEGYTFRGFLDLFPSMANQLVDGVRHEGNRINSQTAHIERVEVLKGPSSTLYGGGAIGATVNLIRKKPSATPAYDLSASIGSWNTYRGTFGATGRLSGENVLYRLDIGAENREGYRHNDATRVSVTPSVAWRIADRNQLNVYYTFNRDSFAGDAGIPMLNTDFGSLLPESVIPNIPRDTNFRTPLDFAESYDHNLQIAFARQLSDAVGFRNTLSYRPVNDDYFLAEFLVVEAPTSVYREFLQFKHHRRPLTNLAEITARTIRGIEQNFVFGWEGQHYRNRSDTTPGGGVVEAAPIDLLNPVETQGPVTRTIARERFFTHNTNAFYAQDHLTLGPKVKALVGGRFDIFRRSTHDVRRPSGEVTPEVKRDAEAFTGRAGVVYQPVPQIDLYASFANSFRPLTQAQPDGTTLEPETGRQVEFGQRFHAFNDRFQINTAVFHIVRENVAFARPGGVFDQASEMTSKGFEVDLSTSVASNWRITGGYGFTDATFGPFRVNATTNLDGNTSPFAPRHTFSLWSAYDWPNGLGVNVGVRAQSSFFIDRTNEFTLDGYGVLNAAVRYRRGPVEYAVNVNNLTDTEYFASVLYDSQLYPGEPINVLGTIRVRFR